VLVPNSMSASQTGTPYVDPEAAGWLDSLEGLPVAEPPPHHFAGLLPARVMSRLAAILPGFIIALLLVVAGGHLSGWINGWIAGGAEAISPIVVAIIAGIVVRQVVPLPAEYDTGLQFCVGFGLRLGIVLLGLRLSLAVAVAIGATALPLVILCIGSALLVVTWLGRLLGLPPRLGALIAVGTSICGVSAVLATGPAINARRDEISYAATCVSLFGLITLLIYPWLAHFLFADPGQVGLFLGTAIHDTSQVAGAALAYEQRYDAPLALSTATVTKLLRNLFMIVVIPLVTLWLAGAEPDRGRRRKFHVPGFILLFMVMVALRSLGDLAMPHLPAGGEAAWKAWLAHSTWLAGGCLALAMAGLGLSTDVSRFRHLGFKPLVVGFVAAATVGIVSILLIRIGGRIGWIASSMP
jgi:uncharacterized integral membrane protein (TIGR00698 family)